MDHQHLKCIGNHSMPSGNFHAVSYQNTLYWSFFLKIHLLDYCAKLFASQRHLNKHLKYHEGNKFACDVEGCGKKFILNSLLTEHLTTHSNIKNFHCDVCSKSFFLQRQLRKHLNGVHSSKSYGCEICVYSNGRRDNLRTHYYRSHNLAKDDVDGLLARGFE